MAEKKLCDFVDKKDLDDGDNMNKYLELVLDGEYVCKKCGRIAKDKDNLCKPKKISKVIEK